MKKLIFILAIVLSLAGCNLFTNVDNDDVSDTSASGTSTKLSATSTTALQTTDAITTTKSESSTRKKVTTTNPIINGKYREITVKGEKAYEIFKLPELTENSDPKDFIVDKEGYFLCYIGNAVNIRFPDKVKWFLTPDCKLYCNGKEVRQFKDAKTFFIPATMSRGFNFMFDTLLAEQIEKVTLGKGIKKIHADALSGAINLKEVILNDDLEEIEDRAFRYAGMPKIKLPKGLKYIGAGVFEGSSLTEINIPEGVKFIRKWDGIANGMPCFWLCKDLKKVTFDGDKPKIYDDDFQLPFSKIEGLTFYYYEGAKGFKGDTLKITDNISYPLVMLPRK